MPFVCCFVGGVRSSVFWTWDARAASLNALGAVAGAGIMAILGVIGNDDNDAPIVVGPEPKSEVVDAPGTVIAAAGMVVTAVLEGNGTI